MRGLNDFDNLPQIDKAVFHSKMQLLAGGFYQVLAMKESEILTDLELFAKSESLFITMIISPGDNALWQAYRHFPPEPLKAYVEKRVGKLAGEIAPAHEDLAWYRFS